MVAMDAGKIKKDKTRMNKSIRWWCAHQPMCTDRLPIIFLTQIINDRDSPSYCFYQNIELKYTNHDLFVHLSSHEIYLGYYIPFPCITFQR